jgi:hypothetical protein
VFQYGNQAPRKRWAARPQKNLEQVWRALWFPTFAPQRTGIRCPGGVSKDQSLGHPPKVKKLRLATRQAPRPSILHGVVKRGAGAVLATGSTWPKDGGAASPPKRDSHLSHVWKSKIQGRGTRGSGCGMEIQRFKGSATRLPKLRLGMLLRVTDSAPCGIYQ